MVLISLGAPAGELGKGSAETTEVLWLAMTHDTFRKVTQLFVQTLNEQSPWLAPGPDQGRKFGRPHLKLVKASNECGLAAAGIAGCNVEAVPTIQICAQPLTSRHATIRNRGILNSSTAASSSRLRLHHRC
jgi:hypothetical protein